MGPNWTKTLLTLKPSVVDEAFRRWGLAKIAQITKQGSDATNTPKPDHPYNMRVMELDMVVINDLGIGVTLTRYDFSRQPERLLSIVQSGLCD